MGGIILARTATLLRGFNVLWFNANTLTSDLIDNGVNRSKLDGVISRCRTAKFAMWTRLNRICDLFVFIMLRRLYRNTILCAVFL